MANCVQDLISKDDSAAVLAILQQNNHFLNEYCIYEEEREWWERWFTPLGWATYNEKLKCVDAISSLPGVDLSRGELWRGGGGSAMYLALDYGREEAAQILARKGAVCTEEEKRQLGKKYTDFLSKQVQVAPILAAPPQAAPILAAPIQAGPTLAAPIQAGPIVAPIPQEKESEQQKEERKAMEHLNNKRARRAIAHWMKQNEFKKLQEWLGKSRNELESLFAEGELPVKGWLALQEKIKSKHQFKANLEGELDATAREKQKIEQQIKELQEKQQELEKKEKEVLSQLEKVDELAVLESEINSIAMLGKKEGESIAKVEEKMKNPFFMETLEFEDVSTLFSMFEMDAIFKNFKDNEASHSIEVAILQPVVELVKSWDLEVSEAMEMLFKLKLIEKGEKEAKSHLEKCSICRSKNLIALLGDYGMKDEERKEIGEKIKEWKGYFFVATTPADAAATLDLPKALGSRFILCLSKIQKAHDWNPQV